MTAELSCVPTGPLVCDDCGTTERGIHYGQWFEPDTGRSGNFMQCCPCGLKAGDLPADHADCEESGELYDPADGLVEPESDPGPTVRVFRNPAGWVMTGSAPEQCTTNFRREQDGRPPCTETAVWKVVEDHGMRLDIGFYCDGDLPAEHRPATGVAA